MLCFVQTCYRSIMCTLCLAPAPHRTPHTVQNFYRVTCTAIARAIGLDLHDNCKFRDIEHLYVDVNAFIFLERQLLHGIKGEAASLIREASRGAACQMRHLRRSTCIAQDVKQLLIATSQAKSYESSLLFQELKFLLGFHFMGRPGR